VVVAPFLLFGLSGCSAESATVQNENGESSEEQAESSEEQAGSSGLDVESACNDALGAVDQLTALSDLVIEDAGAAIDDGADAANDAIRKYGAEYERVAQDLLELEVADPDLGDTIRRFADSQMAYGKQIEEGFFDSGKVEELTDEGVFATIELEGACGR